VRWKKLSYDEIWKGIEACHMNVYRLLESAKRELNAKSYATATMLSILALEEQGRKLALYGAYLGLIEIDCAWWKTMFRSHEEKIALLWLGLLTYAIEKKGEIDFKNLDKMTSIDSEASRKIGKQLQKQKELAMYVTFDLEKNAWLDPQMITKAKSVSVYRQALRSIRATDKYMLELGEDEDSSAASTSARHVLDNYSI